MESERPHGGDGRERSEAADNVVHFPRDWFGPTEDLVPIGPRASQAGLADPEPPAPVRPDDFWGEDAASIHDVLEVAVPPREETLVLEVTRPPVLPAPPRPVPGRRRIGVVAGLAVVAVACCLIGFMRLGASGGSGSLRASLGSERGGALLKLPAAVIDPVVAGSKSRAAATKRAAVVRHRAVALHRRAAARAATASGSGAAGSTQAGPSSSQSAPAYSTPVSTAATSSGGGASASGGGGSSGSGGSGAGPQGPGAPFGPGHLG